MQKIVFEDTTVVKSPYVTIDGVEYSVENGTYQGGTDLNANTFNTMQDNIENALFSGNYNDLTNKPTIPEVIDSLDGDSTTNASSQKIVKQLSTYSGTEVRIGTWIDGKPLYRTVIKQDLTLSINSIVSVAHNISNVNEMCNTITRYKFSWASNKYGWDAWLVLAGVRVSADRTNIDIEVGPNVFNGEYTFILEYTKTTD